MKVEVHEMFEYFGLFGMLCFKVQFQFNINLDLFVNLSFFL